MATRILHYRIDEKQEGWEVLTLLKTELHLSTREINHTKQYPDGMLLDGKAVIVRDKVRAGQMLTVTLHENLENASSFPAVAGPLDILYEDEDLIGLNKEGNMVVHPTHGHYQDSLSNRLAYYYQEKQEPHVLRAIGRLDRETSGVIIFAKNRHAAAVLSGQSLEHTRVKEYLALCHGTFEQLSGTINLPIGDTPNMKMIRRVDPEGAVAITHYKVEKQLNGFALVRLCLETGRTHQIRVHMSYMGHALLGDHLYGADLENWYGMKRCALHSARTVFTHPVTGETIELMAPMPKDMELCISDGCSKEA